MFIYSIQYCILYCLIWLVCRTYPNQRCWSKDSILSSFTTQNLHLCMTVHCYCTPFLCILSSLPPFPLIYVFLYSGICACLSLLPLTAYSPVSVVLYPFCRQCNKMHYVLYLHLMLPSCSFGDNRSSLYAWLTSNVNFLPLWIADTRGWSRAERMKSWMQNRRDLVVGANRGVRGETLQISHPSLISPLQILRLHLAVPLWSDLPGSSTCTAFILGSPPFSRLPNMDAVQLRE